MRRPVATVILMSAIVCALAIGDPARANEDECRARLAGELAKVSVPSQALDFYNKAMQRVVAPAQLKEMYPVRACEALITDMDDALDAYKSKTSPCARLSASADADLLQALQVLDAHVDELQRVKSTCWFYG